MQLSSLFIVTAILGPGPGSALVLSPSAPVAVLVGAPLDTDGGLITTRLAGATLFSLAVACWFARDDGQSDAAKGLVSATVVYNILVYAGIALGLSGTGLWPAAVLDTVLAI